MTAVRDGSHGTTARLPNRVYVVANNWDGVVNRFESWLNGAKDNKVITQCALDDVLEACHGMVLRDPQTVNWAVGWIESGR